MFHCERRISRKSSPYRDDFLQDLKKLSKLNKNKSFFSNEGMLGRILRRKFSGGISSEDKIIPEKAFTREELSIEEFFGGRGGDSSGVFSSIN